MVDAALVALEPAGVADPRLPIQGAVVLLLVSERKVVAATTATTATTAAATGTAIASVAARVEEEHGVAAARPLPIVGPVPQGEAVLVEAGEQDRGRAEEEVPG